MPLLNPTELPRPIVMLSPMAGYTTSAFRSIVKEIAPHVLVCTEIIGTESLIRGQRKTRVLMSYRPAEQPIFVQLSGSRPESFARAAKVAEDAGFAGIDLNMGCPARKVVQSEHGSALILDPERAFAIVAALTAATTLPVTVKTRLGYADSAELLHFASGLESAGAKLLTIHGRTVQQRHAGAADWNPIYEVQRKLSIPVVGNGGVENYRDGEAKRQNLAGFTIGRSALGNPWVFLPDHPAPTVPERLRLMLRHLGRSIEDSEERWGVVEFRKWLPWYLPGIPRWKALQQELLPLETYADVARVVEARIGAD